MYSAPGWEALDGMSQWEVALDANKGAAHESEVLHGVAVW